VTVGAYSQVSAKSMSTKKPCLEAGLIDYRFPDCLHGLYWIKGALLFVLVSGYVC